MLLVLLLTSVKLLLICLAEHWHDTYFFPCGNLFFIKKSHIGLKSKLASFPQYYQNPKNLGSWLLSQNEIIFDWDGAHIGVATDRHIHKGLIGYVFFEFIWYLPYCFSLPSRKFRLVFNCYSFFNKGYRTVKCFFSLRLISKLLVIVDAHFGKEA